MMRRDLLRWSEIRTSQSQEDSRPSENQSSVPADKAQITLVNKHKTNFYSILLPFLVEDSIFGEREEQPRRSQLQSVHEDKPGLQCYSCGSLLNPNKKCDQFSRSDKTQVQTCLKDEACLMYSWKKSATETATLRECFPTRVLLGTIRDPLVPYPECSQRDITDDGSGSIFACLCKTDFCNDAQNNAFNSSSSRAVSSSSSSTSSRQSNVQEQPRSSPVKQIKKCPEDFVLIDGDCYFVSTERVGWIEARKKCEVRKSQLVSLDSDEKRLSLAEYVARSSTRRRTEYWTSGMFRHQNFWY